MLEHKNIIWVYFTIIWWTGWSCWPPSPGGHNIDAWSQDRWGVMRPMKVVLIQKRFWSRIARGRVLFILIYNLHPLFLPLLSMYFLDLGYYWIWLYCICIESTPKLTEVSKSCCRMYSRQYFILVEGQIGNNGGQVFSWKTIYIWSKKCGLLYIAWAGR